MTEELKQKAEKYFKSICEDYNEELERTGKRHYWVGFDIKNAYIAGATENGIQWHDTRHATCIEDYPQDKDKLYAFKVNKAKYEKDTPIIEYMIGSSDDCYYEAMMHKVIAWCEIPQFKE